MPSKAKEKFNERLEEINTMQNIVKSELTETKKERQIGNAIHRASLVMLCSHVEGYVEDILQEFHDELKSRCVDCSKVPAELKVEFCKVDLEKLSNKDCNILKTKIPKFIELYQNLWCSTHNLNSKNIPNLEWKIGNPGSNILEKNLYKNGIPDFWEKIKSIKSTNRTLKDDLDGLVNRRNHIAHGHLESTVTKKDVRNYIKSMEKLIELLDNIILNHMKGIIQT